MSLSCDKGRTVNLEVDESLRVEVTGGQSESERVAFWRVALHDFCHRETIRTTGVSIRKAWNHQHLMQQTLTLDASSWPSLSIVFCSCANNAGAFFAGAMLHGNC